MPPLRVGIVGAGQRGRDAWATALIDRPDLGEIVAVCDPNETQIERLRAVVDKPDLEAFDTLADALASGVGMDAVIIATPDDAHVAPTLVALEADLDVLLEKPVALTADDVRTLVRAEAASGGRVAVAHVLRYAPAYERLKALVADGVVGSIRAIEHVENVGHAHFAHSYVRGNWRSSTSAAPMLLAKACHDLDVVRMLAGGPPETVSSLASGRWFTPGHAPDGAPEFCLDGCPVGDSCPFHAGRIYLEQYRTEGWPRSVVAWPGDDASVLKAIKDGRYGRCVYRCDNDVVDHQTVSMRYASGMMASVTVTAFDARNTRETTVRGSLGTLKLCLEDGFIEHTSFAGAQREQIPVQTSVGHSHEDAALLHSVLRVWLAGRQPLRTGLREAVDSHLMAFAAEASRHAGGVPVAPLSIDS